MAGLLLLALWLGWSLTALWQSQRPAAAVESPAFILAALDHPLQGTAATMALLPVPTCPCQRVDTFPPLSSDMTTLDLRDADLALPYPLIVVQGSRLIYAGPSVLGPGCGGLATNVAGVIQHLLATPQSPMVVPVHCPCPTTEPSS